MRSEKERPKILGDFFGISSAIRSMLVMYRQVSRRTGRTTSMLDALKDGDRVFFVDSREASRVERLCRERGLKVDCCTCPVSNIGRAMERGTAQGKVIFDHTFVEEYYARAIDAAEADISQVQQACSGFGEPHLETRRKAHELAKWRAWE